MQNTLTPADKALAAKILAHCAWMAKYDREYAVAAWKGYCESLPWLELEKIKKAKPND